MVLMFASLRSSRFQNHPRNSARNKLVFVEGIWSILDFGDDAILYIAWLLFLRNIPCTMAEQPEPHKHRLNFPQPSKTLQICLVVLDFKINKPLFFPCCNIWTYSPYEYFRGQVVTSISFISFTHFAGTGQQLLPWM